MHMQDVMMSGRIMKKSKVRGFPRTAQIKQSHTAKVRKHQETLTLSFTLDYTYFITNTIYINISVNNTVNNSHSFGSTQWMTFT